METKLVQLMALTTFRNAAKQRRVEVELGEEYVRWKKGDEALRAMSFEKRGLMGKCSGSLIGEHTTLEGFDYQTPFGRL